MFTILNSMGIVKENMGYQRRNIKWHIRQLLGHRIIIEKVVGSLELTENYIFTRFSNLFSEIESAFFIPQIGKEEL